MGANPDAPEQMLIALERVLKVAEQKGMRSIRIDDMMAKESKAKAKKLSPLKRMIVSLWLLWEKGFHAVFALKTVSPADPIFAFPKARFYRQNGRDGRWRPALETRCWSSILITKIV